MGVRQAPADGRTRLQGWPPTELMPWKDSGGQRCVDRLFIIFEH